MEEEKQQELPEPKTERKTIRCYYCGHRYANRPYKKLTKEDTRWRCEFCRREVR